MFKLFDCILIGEDGFWAYEEVCEKLEGLLKRCDEVI